MDNCRKCRSWRDCTHDHSWFNYAEIRWCPYQIIWILSHADTFRAGEWVARHEESGESRQLHPEGYFVKAGIALAEVEARLETTPNKGEMLLTQVEDGRTLETFSSGAWAILMYIKGKARKSEDFNTWKRKKKYRQKETLS